MSDLPRRLSTADAPPGVDPAVGDIAYYAPWGNLAIFYRDFGRGVIRDGRVILHGQVGSASQRHAAESAVRDVMGC